MNTETGQKTDAHLANALKKAKDISQDINSEKLEEPPHDK